MKRDEIKSALDKVPCPDRLFPGRIRALGQLLGQPLMEHVTADILIPIRMSFGNAWEEQFKRDFKTYGLGEAMVSSYFFSATEKPIMTGGWLVSGCLPEM